MKNYWLETLVVIWWAFILGGTAYLIVEFQWSKWWLLLAIILAISVQQEIETRIIKK